MGKQACTISRMAPINKKASPLTVKPQPAARVLAHDMHGQCLSSDQARVGTRGLANHVGVLAGRHDDASNWPEYDDASM